MSEYTYSYGDDSSWGDSWDSPSGSVSQTPAPAKQLGPKSVETTSSGFPSKPPVKNDPDVQISSQTTEPNANTNVWSIYETLEAAPKFDAYRRGGRKRKPLSEFKNMSTMQKKEASSLAEQLREHLSSTGVDGLVDTEMVPVIDVEDARVAPVSGTKLGYINGVLVPCLLSIWGVIMFLRLGWCIGFAGSLQMTVIILLASLVTTLTTLSLSAIATNGEVKAGGAYFLISRNLGPAWGGSIGVIFSLANAVAVALYVVGFSETLVEIWGWDHPFGDHALRVVGIITLLILFSMCLYGVGWIAKLQIGLLGVLGVAMGSVISGALVSGTWGTKPSDGFTGFGGESLIVGPEYASESFFSVFAVFFPAATGIMAGANISGDLRRPSEAIPKGTLLAIGISTVVYIFLVWIIAAVTSRDGLKDNTLIMVDVSVFGPLVIAGIFAATLSSALAALVGGPRILQAVCRDKLIPLLNPFGAGRASDDEPIKGYFLVFFISAACIGIGDLNAIASLISQLFLISYAFVNYACFASSYTNSYGWRPAFKYYHWSTAALGGFLCLGVMFLVDWVFALIAFVVCGLLYAYILHRDPDVNWGSVNRAKVYQHALRANLSLQAQDPHVKNWRPQVLLLTGDFPTRLPLIKMASFLTERGLLILGNIILESDINTLHTEEVAAAGDWVVRHNIKAFADVTVASSFRRGVRHLMLCSGLGRTLRPNIVMMGFRHTWTEDQSASLQYVNTIRDAMDKKLGVVISRNASLCDYSSDAEGTIDVYWLEDDGGLTAMLPFILSRSKQFRKSKIRLFSKLITPGKDDFAYEAEKAELTKLMAKLRIKTEEINLLTTLTAAPNPSTTQWFEQFELLTRTKAQAFLDNKPVREGEVRLTVDEIEQYNIGWTDYYLRLGELIHNNSGTDAAAIFVSLRIPDNNDAAMLYLAWLDAISHGIDKPIFFVRGGHENILTLEA